MENKKTILSFKHFFSCHIHIRLGLGLMAGFILFTALGSLSHEAGHFLAAKILGHNASINYAFTNVQNLGENKIHTVIILLCGPLQTITTGSLGFLLLVNYRKHINNNHELTSGQWLLIFLALFWLRQVYNFSADLVSYFYYGSFPTGNDEVKLAMLFGYNKLSISLPLAILACIVLSLVFFRFIPPKQRFTFLLSGSVGGFIGYYIWMIALGPILLP